SGLFEFAHLPSGAIPVRHAAGWLERTEQTGVVLVLLPGGTFAMGAERERPAGVPGPTVLDPQAAADEGPVHRVELAPFFLSKYEMTQAQWVRFTGTNPSYWVPGKRVGDREVTGLHPVEQVSWEECRETLRRLGLVLPTEAQWEYAARAESRTPWHTGEDPRALAGHTNLADEGSSAHFARDIRVEPGLSDGYVSHAPVGSYRPNPFGLHDVHGNVWEWCRDSYLPYGEHAPAPGDGRRETADARFRVYRGGGFYDSSYRARSSVRGHDAPAYRDLNLGVRPARAIGP
ncbi:MAG: formylglycine-generating enzyme family protein, partial [Planctomycetes bacterium]|nr:formylglycine-generating enzyme family protein [Planctomycetota bacterium]